MNAWAETFERLVAKFSAVRVPASLVTAGITLGWIVASPAQAPVREAAPTAEGDRWARRVSELLAQFEQAVERDASASHAAAVADLDKKYVASLERALAAASQAADLDAALAVRAEKERVAKGKALPVTDPADTPRELSRLRGIYRETLAKLEAAQLERIRPLWEASDRALADLQDAATREGVLDRAAEIRALREQRAARYQASSATTDKEKDEGTRPATPAFAASSREVAEWALSLDATLRLLDGSKESAVSHPNDLPSGKFKVASIVFPESAKTKLLTDEDLSRLAGLDSLAEFQLRNAAVRGPALLTFRGLPALTRLDLGFNPLNGMALAHLAGHPTLTDLDLSKTTVADVQVAPLTALPALRRLSLRETGVTSGCLATLRQIPRLQYLNIGWNNMHGPGLAEFAEFPALIQLAIDSARLEAADLDAIWTLRRLEFLEIADNSMTDADYIGLAGLVNLAHLGVGGPDLTGEILRPLAKLKSLRAFRFWDGALTDGGIETIIETFPLLEDVHLKGNGRAEATAAGVARLGDLTALRRLFAGGLPVDAAALERIARLPSLHALILEDADLSAEALGELRRPRRLRRLVLEKCRLGEGADAALGKIEGLEDLVFRGVDLQPGTLEELKRALPETNVSASQ